MKPSSLEETGKECMEAEHKLEMNLLEDEHNQKFLFMKEHEIKKKIYIAQEQMLLHKLNTSTCTETSSKSCTCSDMLDFITASDTVLNSGYY